MLCYQHFYSAFVPFVQPSALFEAGPRWSPYWSVRRGERSLYICVKAQTSGCAYLYVFRRRGHRAERMCEGAEPMMCKYKEDRGGGVFAPRIQSH